MLKIGKGLKKKKKSKKHKKDEELFTQEELEQYKREHQQRSIAAAEHIDVSGSAGGYEDSEEHQQHCTSETTKAQDQDEWKKFNELTTGIDSILHKTKDDLDRIKQTSFFKRTPPPKPAPPSKPAGPAEHSSIQDKKNWADFKQEQQQEEQQQFKSEVAATNVVLLEESGSEYETDEDDNIFDTSYVDVVASGEIKLAYIPDDDDQNVTDDIDPFDTSAADKIIRGPEVSKKGKKLVSIGSAVEVLTGRVDPSCLVTARSPSVRRKHQIDDLLIVDEPQEQPQTDSNGNNVTSIAPKSLLDDDIDDIVIDEHPVTLATAATTSNQQPQQQQSKPVLDLNEFDVLATIQNTGDELDDEFTSLATESLKTTVPIILDAKQIQIEPKVEVNTLEWNAFNNEQTTVTSTTDQLKVLQKDLLGSSTTDLSQLHDTITPIIAQDDNDNDDIDPFDTSSIEKINIPGKVELKFIEAELLGDKQHPKQSKLPSDDFDDDDDFNPRQDEQPKQQIITTDDLFEKTDDNDLSVLQSIETLQTPALKPTPALSTDNNQLDEISEDPFDTSFIATVVPGKAELKLIENELATIPEAKNNPVTTKLNKLLEQRQLQQKQEEQIKEEKEKITDLLVVDNDIINTKVLTPVNPNEQIDDQLTYVDPFDTTNNTFNILPGKAELKLLENELLTIQESTEAAATTISRQEKLNDLLTTLDDADDQHFIHNLQPLTPAATTSGEQQQQEAEPDEDFDPFDTTSITTTLVPGVVELKLIESELIQ